MARQDKPLKEFYEAPLPLKEQAKSDRMILKRMRKDNLNAVQALDILNFAINHNRTFGLTLVNTKEENKEFRRELDLLNEIFGWNDNQSLIMAKQLSQEDGECSSGQFQNAFDLSYLRWIQFKDDINQLVESSYIICGNSRFAFFYTNNDCLESIANNTPYVPKLNKDISVVDILNEVKSRWFYNNDAESALGWFRYFKRKYAGHELFEKISGVTSALSGCETFLEMAILALITNKVFPQYPTLSEQYVLPNLFKNYNDRILICKDLQNIVNGDYEFAKIIENSIINGMAETMNFELSSDGAKFFGVSEFIKTSSHTNLKKYNSIKEKELFYDKDTQEQVDRLFGLLDEKNFVSIQQRMEKKKFRIGFNILLYGSAGTGKTETCLQLARITKRDLYIVEVNNFKDKYVGESEKRIKDIFNTYNNIVDEYTAQRKPIPIMLLNEADAIIGIRKKGAENAVDKMENSVQNIILQEMENIKGIMIATTNLTENLDSAFERRFLFKVKYSNPTTEVMCKIWKSNKLGLKDAEIKRLATNYSLSGGEIENIVRKANIEHILSGSKINYDMISNFAENEKLNDTPHKKVGFSL